MTLNTAALAICAQHYGGWRTKDNGCNGCPIRRECQSSHEWSQAGLDAWRERINRAAQAAGERA